MTDALSSLFYDEELIVDAQDRRVRLLESGASHSAGGQSFSWNGRDDAGLAVPDGVYTVKLTATASVGGRCTRPGRSGGCGAMAY